ncbi:hypothetical protein NUU61_010181 [Penicillium alfredii]|uniref:Uncharacterized protein n=1 Tax=Penicillium alfredii TaxID=1506179 RepID=A0A9W9JUS8_9EURO|nr:uncharacterized protein NUU61_010181 [Penicillium alfredii]KAJ5081917.1 hypothetical protein NUU61_010181 [Penicillium alfredii]
MPSPWHRVEPSAALSRGSSMAIMNAHPEQRPRENSGSTAVSDKDESCPTAPRDGQATTSCDRLPSRQAAAGPQSRNLRR